MKFEVYVIDVILSTGEGKPKEVILSYKID